MTTTSRPSLWARTLSWLTRFDEAVNFDSTQYTFERVNALQHELTALKSRVEQLEGESKQVSGNSSTRVAA